MSAHKAGSPIRFSSAFQMTKSPSPMSWVIEGIVPGNSIVGFVGATETLKSAVATDMAVCVAKGLAWHKIPVVQGPVVIVAGEGHGGYARRLKAIQTTRGLSFKNTPLCVSHSGTGLVAPANAKALMRSLDALRDRIGKPPSLIIVDTVARNFGSGDENSATDMGKFIENADCLRRRYGCTVVLVHHTGHTSNGRARGSSAFKAALDAEIIFDRTGPQVTLKCSKFKDAAPFKPIAFDMKVVDLPWDGAAGKKEQSIVLQRVKPVVTSRNAPKQYAAVRVLRDMIKDANEGEVGTPHGVRSRDWWDRLRREGIVATESAFDNLKKRLRKSGAIDLDSDHHVRLAKQK